MTFTLGCDGVYIIMFKIVSGSKQYIYVYIIDIIILFIDNGNKVSRIFTSEFYNRYQRILVLK
jgi:hypothetical protein